MLRNPQDIVDALRANWEIPEGTVLTWAEVEPYFVDTLEQFVHQMYMADYFIKYDAHKANLHTVRTELEQLMYETALRVTDQAAKDLATMSKSVGKIKTATFTRPLHVDPDHPAG